MKKEYFYHNSILKNLYAKCILFLQIKNAPAHWGQGISCASKFLYSPLFYHQNPKFNLIFMFTFFDQIFILIFPIFTIFLAKIVLSRSQDFDSIFMFSAYIIFTPSHQKIITIGIQSIFKKLDSDKK